MAFKAVEYAPGEAYEQIKTIARTIKEQAAGAIAQLAGNVTSGQVIGYGYRMKAKNDQLAAIIANTNTADLIQFSKDQESDQTYDVSAEYTTMSTNVDAVVSQINADFPKTANRWAQEREFGPDGMIDRVFTPASTANILTAITTLHDSIE